MEYVNTEVFIVLDNDIYLHRYAKIFYNKYDAEKYLKVSNKRGKINYEKATKDFILENYSLTLDELIYLRNNRSNYYNILY